MVQAMCSDRQLMASIRSECVCRYAHVAASQARQPSLVIQQLLSYGYSLLYKLYPHVAYNGVGPRGWSNQCGSPSGCARVMWCRVRQCLFKTTRLEKIDGGVSFVNNTHILPSITDVSKCVSRAVAG